ncbi:hypothetical protein EXU85_29830 [Spirosoma sp. KCTC 42546]|uniref:hypothetical protein n=1 Tax=Spirosoma sp. KCTC 42546 TaxID=2520506 RepID=UPI00115B29FC|nr:hypothetical protein [Spirosoma sp. KCTC 42546]QDK82584.1 hypothetical protein EXU85_29830 [Spirosoma sp. KCTC 42546]
MTPYEGSLTKKLTQAIELRASLTKWIAVSGNDVPPEEPVLQALIQRIEAINTQFDEQWQLYWELSEKRRLITQDSRTGIKPQNERLWEEIGHQFKGGTVGNDLIKVLYLKIHHLQLPRFPANRRKPLLYKDLRLHEDSYALLGQYFCWLLDLLQIIGFTPLSQAYCLKELREQVRQFTRLTQEVTQEAETLRNLQLTQHQLYRQLNQVMSAARGRLLTYKREAKRVID